MKRIIAAIGLCLVAAACGGVPEFDDPGEPVRVRPGAEFELVLRSNQSTGCQWALADSGALNAGPVRLVGSNYRVTQGSGNGAGGEERWTFRAAEAGEATVTLTYQRPGETIPPIESRQFRVVVE